MCVQTVARTAIPGSADCCFLRFEAAHASALSLASVPLFAIAICKALQDCLSPPACCDETGLLARLACVSPGHDNSSCSCSKPGYVRKGLKVVLATTERCSITIGQAGCALCYHVLAASDIGARTRRECGLWSLDPKGWEAMYFM